MQSQTNRNFSPIKQNDTPLSQHRREFMANKKRIEQEQDVVLPPGSCTDYHAVDRIHRHDRKNLSGKNTAVKPRRRSKHEVVEKHASSSRSRRGSMRTSVILEEFKDLDFLTPDASTLGSKGRSDRLSRRKRRTQSIVITPTSPHQKSPTSRPMRRKSMVDVAHRQESEHTTIQALKNKFGLGW